MCLLCVTCGRGAVPYTNRQFCSSFVNSAHTFIEHAAGHFLISVPLSLTDDDVLEDVGVVVRCGCHFGTVIIDKEH